MTAVVVEPNDGFAKLTAHLELNHVSVCKTFGRGKRYQPLSVLGQWSPLAWQAVVLNRASEQR